MNGNQKGMQNGTKKRLNNIDQRKLSQDSDQIGFENRLSQNVTQQDVIKEEIEDEFMDDPVGDTMGDETMDFYKQKKLQVIDETCTPVQKQKDPKSRNTHDKSSIMFDSIENSMMTQSPDKLEKKSKNIIDKNNKKDQDQLAGFSEVNNTMTTRNHMMGQQSTTPQC